MTRRRDLLSAAGGMLAAGVPAQIDRRTPKASLAYAGACARRDAVA